MELTNWMKEIEMENKRDQMHDEATPFFLIMAVVVALLIGSVLFDEYKSRQDHEHMSSMISACANGNTVKFGDAMMRCSVKQMVASNE